MRASGVSALVEGDHVVAGCHHGDAVVGGIWVAISGSVPHDLDTTVSGVLDLDVLNSIGGGGLSNG